MRPPPFDLGERPPLVLRVTAAKVGDPALASPEGSAAGSAVKPVMEALGYAPMTFGLSLLIAPVAVAAGADEAARVYERMNACRDRWSTLFGDAPAWFRQTFRDVALADQLAADVPVLVSNARPAVPVERAHDAAAPREPTRTNVAADVQFGIVQLDARDCGALVRSRASVELRQAGVAEPLARRDLIVDRRIDAARLAAWAASPAAARDDLRAVAAEIAAKIALAYPQLVAASVVAAREPLGTRPVCSTNEVMPTGTLRCWYDSLEQCRRVARRDLDGRVPADCVPRAALLPRWCFAPNPDATTKPLVVVADCGGQPASRAAAALEAKASSPPLTVPATAKPAAAAGGTAAGAFIGDALRKSIGLPPDPSQVLGTFDLEGETPELALGTMSTSNERGLLVVTDRSVRYYEVDVRRAKRVMRFDEIVAARVDASGVPFMSSCKCGVVIDWWPGARRNKVELLFIKGPLVGDPDAAARAVQAILAHANPAALAPARQGPWCLMDPAAAPVDCEIGTYEECLARKPGDAYRCVIRE